MPLVPVARIVGAHGLKGYLKLELLTDFPDRITEGSRLRLDGSWVTVRSTSVHQNRLMIRLEGVRDRTEAEALRGKTLEAPDTAPKLEEGEFMVRDLIGCGVLTTDGKSLGTVEDVLPYPAQDVLAIGSLMVPFVKEFVKEVDLVDRMLVIQPIPGMLDEESDAP
ncbi:MAG TPA: ribosome maturation factor RimM [Fimbriimonadaceae bacterium]|nr:ribosome maturation factor RimM [Fimbriimonadaceae bacterium]